MTVHAEDTLGRSGIPKVLNSPLAVSTFEAIGTECLVTGQNRQIFYLISAGAAAVCTVAAY